MNDYDMKTSIRELDRIRAVLIKHKETDEAMLIALNNSKTALEYSLNSLKDSDYLLLDKASYCLELAEKYIEGIRAGKDDVTKKITSDDKSKALLSILTDSVDEMLKVEKTHFLAKGYDDELINEERSVCVLNKVLSLLK